MPSDAELPYLVRAAAAGDQRAWDAIVGRFAPLVWAVARGHGLASAAAGDAAQTTWLRLVESLDTVPAEQLGCWLATSTRADALQALRWADPRLEVRTHRPEAQQLALAQETVPARSRLALRLLAVPDVTMPELAAGLGLSVTDAETLVAQSLDRLSDALDRALISEVPP